MTIVPDGIDPVVGYRSWGFDGTSLCSAHDGLVWPHHKPCEAQCPNAFWEWLAVQEGGETLEDIKKVSAQANPQYIQNAAGQTWHISAQTATSAVMYTQPPPLLPHPNVVLPEGWGYQARIRSHLAPDERCSCGLYASATNHYPANVVFGEVYLWGKVIKGAQAHRAQYAYPKKLYVDGRNDALAENLRERYGCEVEVIKPKADPFPTNDFNKLLTSVPWNNSSGSSSTSSSSSTTPVSIGNLANAKIDWLEDEYLPRVTYNDLTSREQLQLAEGEPLSAWWSWVRP